MGKFFVLMFIVPKNRGNNFFELAIRKLNLKPQTVPLIKSERVEFPLGFIYDQKTEFFGQKLFQQDKFPSKSLFNYDYQLNLSETLISKVDRVCASSAPEETRLWHCSQFSTIGNNYISAATISRAK